MKPLLPLILIAGLSACVAPVPLVTDYNGDSVKIQTDAFSPVADQKAQATAEAQRICAKGSKKRAEYASSVNNSQTYTTTHLFLCL